MLWRQEKFQLAPHWTPIYSGHLGFSCSLGQSKQNFSVPYLMIDLFYLFLHFSSNTTNSGNEIVPKLCNNISIFYLLPLQHIFVQRFESVVKCQLVEIFDSLFDYKNLNILLFLTDPLRPLKVSIYIFGFPLSMTHFHGYMILFNTFIVTTLPWAQDRSNS